MQLQPAEGGSFVHSQATAEMMEQLTGCLGSWGGFQEGVGSREKVKVLVVLSCLTLL